jgi:hypothetical protein
MRGRNRKNRLDPVQALVYRELLRSREWTPYTGWNYGSRAQTIQILGGLVVAGSRLASTIYNGSEEILGKILAGTRFLSIGKQGEKRCHYHPMRSLSR